MTSRTHDMIAFASLLTLTTYYPPVDLSINTSIAALIGCTIGSLLPDIDQESNRLWDLLPGGNFLGKILRHLLLQHRTISHSILGVWLIYKFLWFALPKILNPNYININLVAISVMVGIVAHIAADMLTKEGVPLLFPIPIKIGIPPISQLRITTGKFAEKFIVFPSVIVYLVWFVTSHHEQLLTLLKLIKS